MIFRTYSSEAVARACFNGYFAGSMLLGGVALQGFGSGAGVIATLAGCMFILVASLLSCNKSFRRSGFAVLFCFFTFLYFNIPIAFILFEGSDYIFGDGLVSIPFAQSDYQESLPLGFLYLSVLWIAVWLGIICAGGQLGKMRQMRFSSTKLMHILLLGIVASFVTWVDSQSTFDIRLKGLEKVNSLLTFVFFDHAYLIMTGCILFFKLNEPGHQANQQKINGLLLIIFGAFASIYFLAGVKGAFLSVALPLLLVPYSYFRQYPGAQVSFPSIKVLIVLLLMAPPLFYFALIQRITLGSNIAPDFNTLMVGLSKFDSGVAYDVSKQIFYRLSWGGIDRFLLIFQSFSISSFDFDVTVKFINYLFKNALNLILPGTPFPESYAPSSQLFPDVIHKKIMVGSIETNELILAFNTQRFTIFGIFIIIFGFFAPFFLWLLTYGFIVVFNRIDNVFVKVTMVYMFSGFLTSSGFEVVIGDSFHLLVSILLMYFCINLFSQTRANFLLTRPVKVNFS